MEHATLRTVVVNVLLGDRTEASIGTAVSLLRLQNELAKQNVADVALRIAFSTDVNEALNAVALDAYVVCVDGRVAFEPDFVLGLLDPACPPVVLGVHPLPRVDWKRVDARLKTATVTAKEPLEHAGNVYSVTPRLVPNTAAEVRWVPVDSLGVTTYCVGITPAALQKMYTAAEVGTDGARQYRIFARDGVVDGVFLSKHAWLLHLVDPDDVHADVQYPCSFTGVAEFAGCVGQRKSLR